MDPRAIFKCQNRLRTATQALETLQSGQDPHDFASAWYVFLTAWKNIYTTLEQGSKISAQSRQWFGAKKAERKADQLLQYLFQARNDDEHGLNLSVHPSAGGMLFRIDDVGVEDREIRTEFNPQTGEMKVWRPDGGPLELEDVEGPGMALMVVKDRGGKILAPPIAYKGKRLEDRTPAGVAKIALDHASAMIHEAEALSKPSP